MANTNNTATETLTARQIAWLAENGIETWIAPSSYGFAGGRVFAKADRSLATYRRGTWTLEARDDHEDGDGVEHIADYDTLRDALRELADLCYCGAQNRDTGKMMTGPCRHCR